MKNIFTPEFNLGIKNVRLRGLVCLVISTILPVILSLLTIGGNWLHDTFDFAPVNPEPEDIDIFFGFLIFIPWLFSVFFSIHIIWGMVEVIANRTWAEIPRCIQWIMLIDFGIPTYGMIFYLTYATFQSFSHFPISKMKIAFFVREQNPMMDLAKTVNGSPNQEGGQDESTETIGNTAYHLLFTCM